MTTTPGTVIAADGPVRPIRMAPEIAAERGKGPSVPPLAPAGSYLERLRKMRPEEVEARRHSRRVMEATRTDSPFWNAEMVDANGQRRRTRVERRKDGRTITLVRAAQIRYLSEVRGTYMDPVTRLEGTSFSDLLGAVDPARLAEMDLPEGWTFERLMALLTAEDDFAPAMDRTAPDAPAAIKRAAMAAKRADRAIDPDTSTVRRVMTRNGPRTAVVNGHKVLRYIG
jgi:hypothetical protein